jgi:hypothetical protein
VTNFTIGRVGLDIDVSSISGWTESDQGTTVTGTIMSGLLSDALTIRQQLTGYNNAPDETFVPVTWADRPSVNGFYTNITATMSANPLAEFNGLYDFSITMTKVQGFAAPSFEAVLLGAMRVNSSGITSGTSIPWHGVPSQATGYETGVLTPTTTVRAGVDGNVSVFSDATNIMYNARPAFTLDPASWYKNSAVLKIGGTMNNTTGLLSGGTVVTGRQIPNLPTQWEINNGLIRLTSGIRGTTDFFLSEWNTSAWVSSPYQSAYSIACGYYSSGIIGFPLTAITVLRNSPEEVAIRISTDVSSAIAGSHFALTMDISLRRGARMANVVMTARGAYQWGVAVPQWNAVTPTALTGGWFYPTNDPTTGNRYVVASEQALTSATTPGQVHLTTGGTRFAFGIGVEKGGTGSTGLDTAQSLVYQYMAAQNEKVTVVAR